MTLPTEQSLGTPHHACAFTGHPSVTSQSWDYIESEANDFAKKGLCSLNSDITWRCGSSPFSDLVGIICHLAEPVSSLVQCLVSRGVAACVMVKCLCVPVCGGAIPDR